MLEEKNMPTDENPISEKAVWLAPYLDILEIDTIKSAAEVMDESSVGNGLVYINS